MARSPLWGLIVILHFPFCLYVSVIASQVTIYDEINNPIVDFQPYEVDQDDADKAGQVSLYISIFAGVVGTITDLLDFVILCSKLLSLLIKSRKDRSDPTPTPRGMWAKTPLVTWPKTPLVTWLKTHLVTWPEPSLSRVGYLIVGLRFIMISFWFSALVWGLTPTDVLMYIDIDPADNIAVEEAPYYSDSVIGFMGWLLALDVISCMSLFIERCFLYFIPQGFSSPRKAGEKPGDGHREIESVALGTLKSAGSTPIGHTLSVEDV